MTTEPTNSLFKYYKFFPDGRIYGFQRNKFIKPNKINGGYLQVGLRHGNDYKMYLVHRLMAINFIPNPDNKPEVNHKNGIKSDNRVENLEWVTASENSLHKYRSLGHKQLSGENHPMVRLKLWEVLAIRFFKKYYPNIYPNKRLAEIYNVSYSTVVQIVANKIWV